MTGFGRSETVTENSRLTVEMKSVNHRYFDLSIRMPKIFNQFESQIRALLKSRIERGKVDLYITWEDYSEDQTTLKYNRTIAEEYLKHLCEMKDSFGLRDDLSVSVLARLPEVFVMEDVPRDEEKMWELLSAGLEEAVGHFVRARETEGENLKKDLLEKLADMSVKLSLIEERAPEILKEYRERLEGKVRELLGDRTLDDSRIISEVTIYADRICVDEETVRLRSHIAAAKKELERGGAVGRKLDFIAQEMNREANTTLSKSSDLTISDIAIELKTGIEKIREQVQNIE